MAAERKYALTKVKAGDYLLPSNDGRTIWRIYRYEDGPSRGLDPDVFPHDFTQWAVARWTWTLDTIDPDNWERWETVDQGSPTRREAIEEAMRLGAP